MRSSGDSLAARMAAWRHRGSSRSAGFTSACPSLGMWHACPSLASSAPNEASSRAWPTASMASRMKTACAVLCVLYSGLDHVCVYVCQD